MAPTGLVPNLRLVPPDEAPAIVDDIEIEYADEPQTQVVKDDAGNTIQIEHDDGSVSISLDGKALNDDDEDEKPKGWFDNLVDKIDDMALASIADDLMRGIDDDLRSRNEWIEDRATGIKLLGLRIELPNTQGSSDGAPVDGMSKVRHPMLLEAVLRFQANARSELLPTDGPVKIRNDTNNSTIQDDQLANALQKDMNHYLTAVAREYYPDTDRMLLMLGFGGSSFKKVFFCPLRGRPVSDSVDADDLIVNNSATSLADAKRITHRLRMKASTVRRMQILGAYRDIDLHTPNEIKQDAVREEKAATQGISLSTNNPEDRDREIYECYCELDLPGFKHKSKGKETGLEIPYRVTIDVSSKQILSIVRNYNEDTKDLPEARRVFVKYVFVPGIGFYDIGLLHILGNATNAVTAAWRELLDAGMYANFPGFLFADTGGRQNTNIFRVPPGGGAMVKTGGAKIGDAIMPLPYKEPSQALMALVGNITETASRVGGTAEMAVGEGRQDAPVGTTLALIDQATKILNSVHKRMHTAQAEEFELLLECFKEHPEAFWQRNRKPSFPWDETTFMKAVEDFDLVPQADPNTASQTQRAMKITALKQLQAASPDLYDPIAVDTAALQAIGWSNPSQFMAPIESMGKMPPEMQRQIEELRIKGEDVKIKGLLAQAKIAETQSNIQKTQAEINAPPDQSGLGEANLKLQELDVKAADAVLDAKNRAAERESRERIAYTGIVKDLITNPEGLASARTMLPPGFIEKLIGPG